MHHIHKFIMIMIGSLIFSIGLNAFTIANSLAEGGFTGIAILLHYLFQLPTGWMILLLNIPLFFIAYRIFGKHFIYYTLLGTVSVSVFIELTKTIQVPTDDLLLASLYAGVTTGIGLGIIFRYGGTTAGADIIARLMHKYFGTSLGKSIFVMDILVIAISGLFLGHRIAMYSLVGLFITSRVIDFVQEGAYSAKALYIISEFPHKIIPVISNDMGRGCTILNGKGAYTGNQKEVLLCVVNRSEIVRIKNIIQQIDNRAFVIVYDVREVLGEGFSIH
ncbi:hypothetical protein BHU72_08355 [Desulfuribacillus stibiiarsenatis]|uniref:DUF2179 domain-containing protein n=1 Tax=Desulfuribacillus stibiiarsenatis TaxID=1390249 RepID=A0A1E5L4E6_9FIRM|nr:YitT family protein [Desulfuribacillus stibiiarsenatis]OEH84829.1 hypothetical protein BHU72_08355 [Desulfuribacillus stibiiarsenatis]